MLLAASTTLLLALASGQVSTDILLGVRTEGGGGLQPISTSTSVRVANVAVIPHVGLLFTGRTWALEVEYLPRLYTRFPADEGQPRFLGLSQYTLHYNHHLGHGLTLTVQGNGSAGQADYGQAALLSEAVLNGPTDTTSPRNATAVPPGTVLITTAASGSAGLVDTLEGGDRLTFNVAGTYNAMRSTLQNADGSPYQTFPTQVRVGVDSSYEHQYSSRETLSGVLDLVYLDSNGLLRTANVSAVYDRHVTRELRVGGSAGLGAGLIEHPQPPAAPMQPATSYSSLSFTPTVRLTGTWERQVAPGARVSETLTAEVLGYPDPLIHEYVPRLVVTNALTYADRDFSASLTLMAFSSIAGQAYSLSDRQPALEAGVTATLPVTWHISHEYTLEISGRASAMRPHILGTFPKAQQHWYQPAYFVNVAFTWDYSTQRATAEGR